MCNDGKYIIMSNGTHELVYRDSDDFSVIEILSVHTDRAAVTNLNELSFVRDIFMQIYGQESKDDSKTVELIYLK